MEDPSQTKATVKFFRSIGNMPAGKMADAELHFEGGALGGMKLVGFGIWRKRDGCGYNITFPTHQYSASGVRRSFALLRPIDDADAQKKVRDLIIDAFAEVVAGEEAL
jgi:hypothetical protein